MGLYRYGGPIGLWLENLHRYWHQLTRISKCIEGPTQQNYLELQQIGMNVMKLSKGSAGNSHFNSDADIQSLGYSKVPDKKKALSCSNDVYLRFERRRKRLEERI